MNSNLVIVIISSVMLLAYLTDVISQKIRIPNVLFLITMGLLLRTIADQVGFSIPYLNDLVPVLGTIGLIMIVLEGGLELEIHREKLYIVRKAIYAAIGILLVCLLVITFLLYFFYGNTFYKSLLNAVPLSVISSAIAIPSVAKMSNRIRDFVTYETSLSDIFGIMIFNFVLANEVFHFFAIVGFVFEFIVLVVLSVVFTLFLAWLLPRIGHHVKFIPILSIVLVVYSVAKMFHLSPLLFILVLGLFMNNSSLFMIGKMKHYINDDELRTQLPFFKTLTTEFTFIIRVFFFILFGFSTTIAELVNGQAMFIASLITVCIFLVRMIYVKWILRLPVVPLAFISPRGLINIVLAISIPVHLQINGLDRAVLLWTVIFTVIVMAVNVMLYREKPTSNIV